MISRRNAVKLGAAGIGATSLGGSFSLACGAVSAQEQKGSTWNWAGNERHTGEFPGPGLDLSGPIGELWRIPADETPVAVINGMVYTILNDIGYEQTSQLSARNGTDGSTLWVVRAPSFAEDAEPNNELPSFRTRSICVDEQTVYVCLTNSELWALDIETGGTKWTWSDPGSDKLSISDGVAYIRGSEDTIFSLSLSDPPDLLWQSDYDWRWEIIGIDNAYVYLLGPTVGPPQPEIRVISRSTGVEFWRQQASTNPLSRIDGYGVSSGNLVLRDRSDPRRLVALGSDGMEAWSAPDNEFVCDYNLVVGNLVARTTATEPSFDSARFQTLSVESGMPIWEIDTYIDRWDAANSDIVVGDGILYFSLDDRKAQEELWNRDHRLDYELNLWYALAAFDPSTITLRAARYCSLGPLLVGDGMLLAFEPAHDGGFIVAIGTTTGKLQPNGRAKVTNDTTLRGAPNDSAMARAELATDMLVTATGDNDNGWLPVRVTESGVEGWVSSAALEGLDGDIIFEQIDISEIGVLTVFDN